jgi:hypothetical protein
MARLGLLALPAACAAALVLSGVAVAAPPAATTSAAGAISPTAARLNGAVDPRGQSTTWYFQLGTTTAYGTNTAAKSAGAGSKAVGVSISLSGLAPGTTYNYRIVASNGSGTTFGANQTFTTTPPPSVQTQGAQGIGVTGATLVGAVAPNTLATRWSFEYGTGTNYGARTPDQTLAAGNATLPVSVSLAGLGAGTLYHYRLVATSAAGTSYGADLAFTTLPALTLRARAVQVVHGGRVALSGAVTGGATGVPVTILAAHYGASSYTPIGTTFSRNAGSYVFYVRPTIGTSYEVSANGGTTPPVTIGVRPAVTLTALRQARLKTHVTAGVQLIGRLIQLQRREGARWVTVKQLHLSTRSTAIFHASALPHGRSTIRIALSVNEAGPGLLAGFSRELHYRRR